LVAWFINGKCKCAERCGDPAKGGASASNLKARLARCLRAHNVFGWDPLACSFLDFVFQAVKGFKPEGAGRIKSGALVQGMHYYHLQRLNHIQFVDVLVWVCPHDGTRNFEKLPCLECRKAGRGRVLVPDAWRTVQRWLVVAEQSGARFQDWHYWSCQYCRDHPPADQHFPGVHYYPDFHDVCPKCGHRRTRGAKQSRVFIMRPPVNDDREVPLHEFEQFLADLPARDAGRPVSPADFAEVPEPEDEPPPRQRTVYTTDEIHAAIEALDKPLRWLVRARHFRHLTMSEIAETLSLPVGRLEDLHAAAMRKLLRTLQGGTKGKI
jgi:hypothetical protein